MLYNPHQFCGWRGCKTLRLENNPCVTFASLLSQLIRKRLLIKGYFVVGVPHARGRKNSWNFYKDPEVGLNEAKNVI